MVQPSFHNRSAQNKSAKRFGVGGSAELVLKRIRDIPALPEVVNKIIQLLGKPNTPASEIAKLVSYDAGLTSRVLRMVNSAAYGVPRQISSIQHGIMILGFNTVRGLVLSASIFKLFKGSQSMTGMDHKAFWTHCLMTAIAAKQLATVYGLESASADDAFSAGMLHDIGKVVLDTYFHQEYEQVMAVVQQKNIPQYGHNFYRIERAVLGGTHGDIGGFVSEKWRLPASITEVIRFHHEPEKAEHSRELVFIVALANQLSHHHQQGDGEMLLETVEPGLVEYFELTQETLDNLNQRLGEDLASAGELLTSLSNTEEG